MSSPSIHSRTVSPLADRLELAGDASNSVPRVRDDVIGIDLSAHQVGQVGRRFDHMRRTAPRIGDEIAGTDLEVPADLVRLSVGIEPVADGASKRVAFNVVPHIDRFLEGGFTKEEMKIIWETRKILEDPNIMVNPTVARVPVYFGHSEAVHLETRTKVTVGEVQKLLNSAAGVVLLDGRETGAYPTAATDAAGRDAVFVGRVREDPSHPRGIDLWVVSDNVRKGAALNSVQIAEILVNRLM